MKDRYNTGMTANPDKSYLKDKPMFNSVLLMLRVVRQLGGRVQDALDSAQFARQHLSDELRHPVEELPRSLTLCIGHLPDLTTSPGVRTELR